MSRVPNILASFLTGLRRDRDRWVLWLPVFFGTGIAVYFGLRAEPPWWIGPGAVIAAGLAAYLARKTLAGGGAFGVLMLAIGIAGAGFWAAQWRTVDVAHTVLNNRIGPTTVTGRVAVVESFPDSRRVTLDRARISGLGPERVPEKIRLRLRGPQPDIIAGGWIRVRAILSAPPRRRHQAPLISSASPGFVVLVGLASVLAPLISSLRQEQHNPTP